MQKDNAQRKYPLGFFGSFLWILAIFLVAPVVFRGFYIHVLLECGLALLMLFSLYSLSEVKWPLLLGSLLGIPFIVIDLLSVYFDSLSLMTSAYIIFSVYILWMLVFLGSKVFNHTFIDTNLIFGAILIYLLAGVLWSKLYWLTETFSPESFQGVAKLNVNDGLHEAYKNEFDLLYYSFTIITSVGLGDVLPLHHMAKSFTMLEAVFGQLFVAIAIAKMVTIWRTHRL